MGMLRIAGKRPPWHCPASPCPRGRGDISRLILFLGGPGLAGPLLVKDPPDCVDVLGGAKRQSPISRNKIYVVVYTLFTPRSFRMHAVVPPAGGAGGDGDAPAAARGGFLQRELAGQGERKVCASEEQRGWGGGECVLEEN